MNNIKNTFSIKDLENLTGIKAHTIRIWEKRYNLLKPNRTDTNIRYYSLKSLQNLLNISYLNSNGYKISHIAELKAEQIPTIIQEIASNDTEKNHSLNVFKVAMLNFDLTLFQNTYNNLLERHSFRDIFLKVFIPLLEDIGLLWQTDTISPAQEHFITELIKQKILINAEKALANQKYNTNSRTYVLYLPANEIHELGLQFLNYELLSQGHHCIYLGSSVPIESLTDLESYYTPITFVTAFTIRPLKKEMKIYLDDFNKTLLEKTNNNLWVCGRMTEEVAKHSDSNDAIETFFGVNEILERLQS
jgi:DNA-binding transcriptional MerR regulator